MTTTVFVDGQEGTTGLRLLDYLTGRSDIELLRIDESKRKDPAERAGYVEAFRRSSLAGMLIGSLLPQFSRHRGDSVQAITASANA